MKRVRMGIQSGSDQVLEFYDRPNKPGLIPHATSILAEYKEYRNVEILRINGN